MFKRVLTLAIFGTLMLPIDTALADCAGLSASAVEKRHQQGLTYLRNAQDWQALKTFDQALAEACDRNTETLMQIARRAASLGEQYGRRFAQQKQFYDTVMPQQSAFHWYEMGGQFALADQMLIEALKKTPDDRALSEFARNHFSNRSLPSFHSNEAERLRVTGAYHLDDKHLPFVHNNQAEQFRRLLAAADSAANTSYLRASADMELKPFLLRAGDISAAMALQQEMQAFQQRWPNDGLRNAERRFSEAHSWLQQIYDESQRTTLEDQRNASLKALAARLHKAEPRSPKLQQAAIDFYRMAGDEASAENVLAKTNQQAAIEQNAKHYSLAAELYRVAQNETKADVAQQLADQQMQSAASMPSAEQMQQLQQQYMNPETIKALQAQALELQKQMQAQSNESEQ